MKKRVFALLLCLVCALSLGGCQEESWSFDFSFLPEYYAHPEWLSDDLDERFQQMFYYALDNPTVDGPFPPDSDPNDTIPSGNGNDRYLFNNFYFIEQNFIKGSFFLIEPPYSVVGVGLDRYVLRGIYDVVGGERDRDGDFYLTSFSMEIELGECELSDLSLSHRDLFRLQNQNIPLITEEKDGILYLTADLDKVSPIEIDALDLEGALLLHATVSYQGEEYEINGRV